ncbi:glycine cleavage system aminomethyltransferase GcvT [Piscirickettsia salmonis]|uniref:glycine cleavage system aminomethyltransferase GcvT n=1 Tax=Piscirickettsia salmonis TaxID=1238 RepID=UPI000F0882CB|nr:glycine cleavage system aminomethyltransferase GcvT [Piscirickettsiaceae bacterium NZ-RLO2]
MRKTALYDLQDQLSPRWVDFAGWQMPIYYGSQLEEHLAVRNDAGMFDVSHMQVVDVKGADAKAFFSYLLANDINKLKAPGKALYSCMLNHEGGVIDDLIVYYLGEEYYRIVVNAGCADKDIAWIKEIASQFAVTVSTPEDVAIIAVQGPQALARVISVLSAPKVELISQLQPFAVGSIEGWTIARTGYSGEDGLELILPVDQVTQAWQDLITAGITPCGLGARDTLRLEAGLNLFGQDMDEVTHPYESNLGWTVALEPSERNFIGRQALEAIKAEGVTHRLVSLVMTEKGVLRHGQKVIVEGVGEGVITSGTFSPSLGVAIAFARIPVSDAASVEVEIRNKRFPAHIVRGPFVRMGKPSKAVEEILA